MSLPMTKDILLKNRKRREAGQSSSVFTLPPGLDELPDSVLKLHSFLSELSFSDGICGTFLPHTKEYITSPNCNYIPSPPLGSTRDLYRRSDARYGDDDPICWPQPFNLNYPWNSAITRKPTILTPLADNIMWLDLRASDLTYTAEGAKRKEGVVKKELIDMLDTQIAPLKSRTLTWHQINQDGLRFRFVKEHTDTVELCLNRLKTVSGSIRVQQLALTELQRGFLSVQALLEFTELESCSSTSDTPLPFKGEKMGAFVWNDRDARLLYHAGLPVFYIRPWIEFDRQIVTKYISLQQPSLPQVQMAPANPPYHTIMMGQAGSDSKFTAIRQASIQCFDVTSPFQNLHLPGGYISSFELGKGKIMAPASSPPSDIQSSSRMYSNAHFQAHLCHSLVSRHPKARKSSKNPPAVQRDTFADLPEDDPMVPPAIIAWKDVNIIIDQKGVLPGKRSLTVPDPGLFFRLQHQDRQSPYLFMWQHLRDAWLASLEYGRSPLTVELWRKILAYIYLQPIEPGQVITPKMQATLDAKKIVEDVIRTYDSRMVLTPAPSSATFDPSTARRLIRELCMINFRSEFLYVDRVLDTSKPVPQRTLTMAEFDAACAQHRRDRIILLNNAFLYDTLVPHPDNDLGLAAVDWSNRYNALKHFWSLLDTWPLSKPALWRRGMDMDLSHQRLGTREGAQWERTLAEYYVRSVFTVLKHAPSLPRRLA